MVMEQEYTFMVGQKMAWYKVRVKNKKNGKQGYMYTEFVK